MKMEKLNKSVCGLHVLWEENLSSSASWEQNQAIIASVFNKERKKKQKNNCGFVLPAMSTTTTPL